MVLCGVVMFVMLGQRPNFRNRMLAGLALLLTLAVSHAQQYVTIDTQYGPVMGNVRPTVEEWLGVPFAQPPGRTFV